MSTLVTAADAAPLTTMASAMFFGSVFVVLTSLTVKTLVIGDYRAFQEARNPRASPLDLNSFSSIYTLLYHFSIFGLILFYAYLCEYHPPNPHSPKSYDRDEFFFLTALLILVSLFTLEGKKFVEQKSVDNHHEQSQDTKEEGSTTTTVSVRPSNEATEILNRDQTEEWKGWMQFMFLLYHYYHAEEVYNAIRVMITCYVWMTGFGNFSFFYLKADYSAVRVIQMLWRLNFLVAFLCLTQGTTYILYYICLLHTFFFLMVYVTMRVCQHVNYTKYGIRFKLLAVAIIIFVVWDLDSGIFRIFHWPFLGEKPILGAPSGSMWEWYFRSSLDHWSTYLGMLFALNFPITSLHLRKLEAQPLVIHVLAKVMMAIPFVLATAWWVMVPFSHGKVEYNNTNAYFAWIPLFSYIYFRNITLWLRSHTLGLLHQIGKTTLETYLMQHHIWLTSNAKSLLTLIPGWPKMNFLVVTVMYFFLSRRLYQLTLFLRGMVLPNNRNECFRNLSLLVASIGSFVAAAFLLRLLGMLNLVSVAIMSLTVGLGLSEVVSLHVMAPSDRCCRSKFNMQTFLSPMAGAVTLLVLGLIWHGMAIHGASKIIQLPPTCDIYANNGRWVSLDTCNEQTRGQAYRSYEMSTFGTCSPQTNVYAWGWEKTPSNEHCRFIHRDAGSLLKTLEQREVTFIGDSVVRHLYHAMCRQVGDKTAGAYNTTLGKWIDFSRRYKSTQLEFIWAPYSETISSGIDNITMQETLPDIVVTGGGAWDRLHRFGNESEIQTFTNSVEDLTKKLAWLRSKHVSVVWVVPTTINTWALMTDEKLANIREDQMASIRELYKEMGIYDSVSFVLDGPSFTKDRVSESYDGVHYPLSVYDAGAQILANAIDWLLPQREISLSFTAPRPGSMANPFLGLIVLIFVCVGLFLMDGYMGVSYVGSILLPNTRPVILYREAFATLHKLAGISSSSGSFGSPSETSSVTGDDTFAASGRSEKCKSSEHAEDSEGEEEFESLLRENVREVPVI